VCSRRSAPTSTPHGNPHESDPMQTPNRPSTAFSPSTRPPGSTSHDVVAIVRRVLNTKKVGHCGTLDPMATGSPPADPRQGNQDPGSPHERGQGICRHPGSSARQPTRRMPTGKSPQRLPFLTLPRSSSRRPSRNMTATSTRLPRWSRRSRKTASLSTSSPAKERPWSASPASSTSHAHLILRTRLPEVDFRVVCSKGFYVRTYAHDIGRNLGCGAHLNALRRTKSGRFDIEMAFPADQLKTAPREEILAKLLTLPQVSRLRGA